MRIEAASKRTVGLDCRICVRRIRAGQLILHDYHRMLPFGRRDLVTHLQCLDRLLADKPVGPTFEDFEEIRQRISASGKAFPTTAPMTG